MTTGEHELASFESVGAGAPPLNSSSNYVPSLSGQLSDWTMPAGPVQGLVEGAIDGAAHKTAPEGTCPAEDQRAPRAGARVARVRTSRPAAGRTRTTDTRWHQTQRLTWAIEQALWTCSAGHRLGPSAAVVLGAARYMTTTNNVVGEASAEHIVAWAGDKAPQAHNPAVLIDDGLDRADFEVRGMRGISHGGPLVDVMSALEWRDGQGQRLELGP